MAKEIKGIKVNNEDCQLDISSIVGTLTSPDGTQYVLKVDNEGRLYADDGNDPTGQDVTTSDTSLPKFYINEFYCGGKGTNEHTMNYCSHHFVELANLTNVDLKLDNVYLKYCLVNGSWDTLKLEGVIKSGSTFLIRGAQCSMIDSPTCKIKVDSFDMEWYVPKQGSSTEKELISFGNEQGAFYLTLDGDYNGQSPYDNAGKKVSADQSNKYINVVGVHTQNYKNVPYEGPGSETGTSAYVLTESEGLMNTKIFRQYYAMDPVKQATKTSPADRSNANQICYVDLTKNDGELIPNIEVYTPRAVNENKNIFYNKTKLDKNKPSVITCSFGIQATDNEDGNGATRCFNWVSSNVENNFIWIRPVGETSWSEYINESFYENDGRHAFKYYDRSVRECVNNTAVVVNKFIKHGLIAGEYEYLAGSRDDNDNPIFEKCTAIKKFTIRKTDDVSEDGFKFIQTSDQQGFNWEEYQVWRAAAKVIAKEGASSDAEFMINTGDMTQNGFRLGEWLDYFDAKGEMFNNMEEMAAVGNNDLCLNPLYTMAYGEDSEKIWAEGFDLFYTVEVDERNVPVFDGPDYTVTKKCFVPSLYSFNYGNVHFICVNSEIKPTSETSKNGYALTNAEGVAVSSILYPQIEKWCEKDIELNSGSTWNVLMCHEMPFTILTADKVKTPSTGTRITNKTGCNACYNTTKKYWLSEFCQTHNIRLVIGGHKHTQATTYPIIENITYDKFHIKEGVSDYGQLPNTGNEEYDVRKVRESATISGKTIPANSNYVWVNGVWNAPDYYGFDFSTVESGITRAVDTNHPIMVVDSSVTLVEYNGYKYPDTWFSNGEPKDPSTERKIGISTFEYAENIDEGTVPVLYAMSQATGYKHTSNKELPSPDIPWLQNYFPAKVEDWANIDPKAAAGQKFPFFTIWTITENKIEGKIRKVNGIFDNKGKFDINRQGPNVKAGKSSLPGGGDIESISGVGTSGMGGTGSDLIEINA